MNTNISLGQEIPLNSFRQFAIWAWGNNTSPNIFLTVEFDVSNTIAYLSERNNNNFESISIFHVFLKIMGLTIEKFPDLNRVLIRKKIYRRESIDLFIIKAKKSNNPLDRYDLEGLKLKAPQHRRLKEFAPLLRSLAKTTDEKIRTVHKKWIAVAKFFPLPVTKCFVGLYDWLAYSLNMNPEMVGFPQDEFGSMWVSDIGSFGLPSACVPLFPVSRCGLGASIGQAEQKPVVVDGQIVIRDIVQVTLSCDHRLFDASHAAKPINYMKKLLKNPELLDEASL